MQNPISIQVFLSKSQDLQGLDIVLDDNRKVVVENISQFEPLSKYIDADRLFEYQNMKMQSAVYRIDNHTKVIDMERKLLESPVSKNYQSNQQNMFTAYQDVKRDQRNQIKSFNTRAYSVFTQKRNK